MKKFRVLLLVLLGVVAPISLSVVGAQAQVELLFYSYNLRSGLAMEATLGLLAEFHEQNPDIVINAPEGLGAFDILPRVQAELAAGIVPDVAQILFGDMRFVVSNNIAQPLEDVVGADALADHLEGFVPQGVTLGQFDGKTYGIPYSSSTPLLWINADIFEAAGLDPNDPPTTWEDAKSYALQITERTDFDGLMLTDGFFAGPGQADYLGQSLIRSNGGNILSEATFSLTYASPDGIEAISMVRDLRESGALLEQGINGVDLFQAGNLGMLLHSAVFQSTFVAAADGNFELRAAPMPSFGEKPTTPLATGAALFMLTNDPAKQEAAWRFMQFMTSERAYTVLTSQIGYLPWRLETLEDPEYLAGWYEDNRAFLDPNLAQMANVQAPVSLPGNNAAQILEIMGTAMEEAVYTDGDVEAILTAAQEQAQALLPSP